MVFRSRAERTVAALDRALSEDPSLARLATLFAEPPGPGSSRRSRHALLCWARRPSWPLRRVLLALAVLVVLGGATASAMVGLPGPALGAGVLAGVGAVWLLAEIVGRKVVSRGKLGRRRRRHHRLRRLRKAHQHRRWMTGF